MSLKITIHQPEHMPWLGLFHKIAQVDLFVVLDNVQYRDRYFQNRNRIRLANGEGWITVPVAHRRDTMIQDVQIADDPHWKRKWWNSIIHAYGRGPFSELVLPELSDILQQNWVLLPDLNVRLIQFFLEKLGVQVDCVRASSLGVQGKAGDLILDICRKTKADVYLSGISGRDYLELNEFANSDIQVFFQEFHHPIYEQRYKPFIPCLSIIDLLCNYGPRSLDIINGVNIPVMDELFL